MSFNDESFDSHNNVNIRTQWKNAPRSNPVRDADSSDSDQDSPSRNRRRNVAILAKDSLYAHGRSGTFDVSEPISPQENRVRVISRKDSRKVSNQSTSFVPKAVRASSYQHSSGDEQRKDSNTSNNWAKVPKRFLAEEHESENSSESFNRQKEKNGGGGWHTASPGGIVKKPPSSAPPSSTYIESDGRSEASADTIDDPNVMLSSTRAVAGNEAKFIFPDMVDDLDPNSMNNGDSSSSSRNGRNSLGLKQPVGETSEDDDHTSFTPNSDTILQPQPPSRTTKGIAYTASTDTTDNSSNNNNRLVGWIGPQTAQQAPPTTTTTTPQPATTINKQISFVQIAHPRGLRTEHVQCTIIRDRTSMQGKLYPTYELILEDPRKSLIIARKMSLNRTSNYHLFDMTRGYVGAKLSKKAGNYLGKLRAKNTSRTGYALMNHNSDREEIGAIIFERPTIVESWTEGNQPRVMKMLLPALDSNNVPVATRLHSLGRESMFDVLQAVEEAVIALPDNYRVYQTKEPVFENGNYRLNFHGRVGMPSVKNFQIVSEYDIDDIVCQFGKVDKDVFHLDYKAPLNAIQAFALALCQFNL